MSSTYVTINNLLTSADATLGAASAEDTLTLATSSPKTITPAIVRKVERQFTNFCAPSENQSYVEGRKAHLGSLSPGFAVVNALKVKYGIVAKGEVKTVISQPPAHGRVNLIGQDTAFYGTPTDVFEYTPDKDFLGDDKVVFEVTVNGQKFRVGVVVRVVHGGFNDACVPEGEDRSEVEPEIYISLAELVPLFDGNDLVDTAALTAGKQAASFGLLATGFDPVSVTVAPLDGGAVGKTVAHTITLDDDAAGYGWFIDLTPGQNEEFLPTADPNVWKAKPGSAAEGKMDMLSVLLHEYGHALGLDHTADAHDFMAATLLPGTRRTLSAADQMMLMRLTGYVPVPDSPSDPFSPFLGAPLVCGLGRLRGSFSDVFTGTGESGTGDNRARMPQYEVAPNPTLINPEFAGSTGWNTTGTVTFGNHAAVLTESATAQTRLNQLFVVNEHDRFLQFTLSDIALDDVNAAPDDAFEVALVDANTGASLLGGTGLTRTDALLNLQANGAERLAPQVTSTLNPDGSRTYLVDLSGVAAGTVASLSFDLIGFGRGTAAISSHVTVRDLKLGIPETHDDTVTTAEDTPAIIAAFSSARADAKEPLRAGLH